MTHYGLILLIKQQMADRNMTANQLAEMLRPGTSRQTVYNLLKGRSASIETLMRVFRVLDIDIHARKPRKEARK